jgi:hypothetical protein
MNGLKFNAGLKTHCTVMMIHDGRGDMQNG